MQLPQNKLFIKQKVEALEIFTDFETKNRYRILDETGNDLYFAYEESNLLERNILGNRRKLKVQIIDNNKTPQLVIEKPFFFLRANFSVKSPDGKLIGTIKQRKWFITKSFEIFDSQGQLILTCIAKMPHIWTFNIFRYNQQVAQILKKWSGLGKEAFTDVDTFLVDFGSIRDENQKELILAAAFAVDLRVFERKG